MYTSNLTRIRNPFYEEMPMEIYFEYSHEKVKRALNLDII